MPGTPTTSPPGPTNPQGALPFKGELRLIDGLLSQFDGTDWVQAIIPAGQLDSQPVYKDPATGEVTLSNGLIVAGGVTADTLAVTAGLTVVGGLQTDSLGVTGNSHVQGTETVDGNLTTNAQIGAVSASIFGAASVGGALTAGSSHISGNEQVDGTLTANGFVQFGASAQLTGDMNMTGSFNAGADVAVGGGSLPRGPVAWSTVPGAVNGPASSAANFTVGSVSITVTAGRLYRFIYRGNIIRSDAAADSAHIQIMDGNGGALIDERIVNVLGAFYSSPIEYTLYFIGAATNNFAPAAGNLLNIASGPHGIYLSASKTSGTGNAAFLKITNSQWVWEDLGT